MLIRKFKGKFAKCPKCGDTIVLYSNGMPSGGKYCSNCGCKLNYRLAYKDYNEAPIERDGIPNCVKFIGGMR